MLVFGINGTVRFMFVWLMVTLTDWSAAEGLVGIALGVPALLLSLPAGAWSDRVDRQRFCMVWMTASAAALGIFAIVIGADLVTPSAAGLAAVIVGTCLIMMQPNLNAIVPLLVPRERLMNAAALQNGRGQSASFLGLAVGGLVISLFGNAAGFGLPVLTMRYVGLATMYITIPLLFRKSVRTP